jgi:hypothetical protein
MSTKHTTKTNSTQTAAPPSWTAPGMQALGDAVTGAIGSRPPMYQGPMIAGPSTYDLQAPGAYASSSQDAANYAQMMQGIIGSSMQGPTFGGPAAAEAGNFANYDSTAIRPVIDAALQPVTRQLMEQILPSIASSGIESGSYGGSRNGTVLPSMALDNYSRNAGEIATGLAYQDFGDTAARALQAYGLNTQRGLGEADVMTQRLGLQPDLMNEAMRLSTGSADLLSQAGATDRANTQMGIDDALAQWQYQTTAPYAGLDTAASILAQIGNPWGTQTGTSKTTEKTSGLGTIAQGIMGAGMMAAGMGFNPFGAAGNTLGAAGTVANGGAAHIDAAMAKQLWGG